MDAAHNNSRSTARSGIGTSIAAALRKPPSRARARYLEIAMLKQFLQGKWLGHPLHPALAHIPMGLFPAALVFDILSRAAIGGNAMVQASFYSIFAGLIVGLLAAPAGVADWLGIKPDRPAYKLALWHMGLNALAVVLWAINLGLRWNDVRSQTRVASSALILSLLGAALLIVSGYLGSRMVFDQGIGVARFSKGKWCKLALENGSNAPPESSGERS